MVGTAVGGPVGGIVGAVVGGVIGVGSIVVTAFVVNQTQQAKKEQKRA